MKIQPKYEPIYHNASMLLRPKTGLKDMIIELSPGNPIGRASCPAAARCRSRTRCRTSTWTRSSPRSTATRAPTCGSCSSGAAQGLNAEHAANLRGHVQALRADGARLAKITTLLVQAPGEPAARDPQLPAAVDRAEHARRLDLRVRGLHQRGVPAPRQPGRQHPGDAAAAAAARCSRRTPRSPRPTAWPTCSARPSRRCGPTARALGPALGARRGRSSSKTTPIIKNQLRPFTVASIPTIAQAASPPRRTCAAADAEPRRRRSRSSTTRSTSWPTTRPAPRTRASSSAPRG